MSENIGRYNVLFEIITKQGGDIEKIKNETTGLQGIFNRAKGAFAGIIGAQVVTSAISSIKGIINSTIGMAAQFETASQSFKVLLGSAKEAEVLLKDLNEFSILTPFEPAEINASAKTLLGFGRTAREVKEDIEIIGNASAATGANLQSLSTVFGQVAGIGKLGGQDALQFINQGLPIYQILAESMGKSVTDVKKLQTEGKITFDILRKAFIDASKEGGKFFGGLEEQSNTFSGLMSTLTGNIGELKKSIGLQLLPILKPIVKGFSDFFNFAIEKVDTLTPKIKQFIDEFRPLGKFLFELFFSTLKGGLTILLSFANILLSIPTFIRQNWTSIKLLGIALLTFNAHLIVANGLLLANRANLVLKAATERGAAVATGILTVAQKGLNAAFRANPIGLVITAVLALIAVFKILYDRSETVRNVFAGLLNVFNDLIKEFKEFISAFNSTFEDGLKSGISKIGTNIKEKFISEFKQIFAGVQGILEGEFEKGLATLTSKLLKYTGFGQFANFIKSFQKGFENNKAIENLTFGGGNARANLYKNFNEKTKPVEKKEDDKNPSNPEDLLKKEIMDAELRFALREKEKRETIKNEVDLKDALERNEIKKQFALAQIRLKYSKVGSLDYVEQLNIINKLEREYKKFFTNTSVDPLDSLAPDKLNGVSKQASILNQELAKLTKRFYEISDPKLKAELKQQIDDITSQILSFQSPKLNKLTFEGGGFDAIDIEKLLPEDQVNAMKNRLSSLQGVVDNFKPKNITELIQFDKIKNEIERLKELLNSLNEDVPLTTKEKVDTITSLALQSANALKNAYSEILKGEIDLTNTQISEQEKRVSKAEELAEKGKVKQLQIEEARLQELEDRRREHVEAQRAISALEIAQSNSVAAANSIQAITASFKEGGFVGIATGIATAIALAAQIAVVSSSISNAFNDIPSYIEGTELVKGDNRFKKFKRHNDTDGYTANFDGSERIVDPFVNSKLKGFPNSKLPEAVAFYKANYPKINPRIERIISMQRNPQSNDNKNIISVLDGLRKDIQSIKISTKLDRKGFTQSIERDIVNVRRRSKIRG